MAPTVIQGRKVTRILPPINAWNAISRHTVQSTSHSVEPVEVHRDIATPSSNIIKKLSPNTDVENRDKRTDGEKRPKRRRASTTLVSTQLKGRRLAVEPPPILPPIRTLPTRTRQQGLSPVGKNKLQNVRRRKSAKTTMSIIPGKENLSAASQSLSIPRSEVQVVIYVNSRAEQQSLREPGRAKGWSPKRLRPSKTGASGAPAPLTANNNRDVGSSVENDVASHITVSVDEKDTRAEGQEYEVERIHGEMIAPGIHEYLIEWVGYAKKDWIDAKDCFCADRITEFRTVQRERLLEATQAGRRDEANMLRELADAERIRSERNVIPKPKSRRISSSRRDAKTGRFLRTKSRDMGLEPRALGNNINQDDSGQDDVVSEQEETAPRDVRANTARLTSRAPTIAHRNHVRDDATGEVMWVQPRVSQQDRRVSLQNLLELGSTRSRENVTAWIAENIALEQAFEDAEARRRTAENLADEVRRQQEKVAEDQRLLAALNMKRQEIEARDMERKNMERERLEREEQAKREAEIEASQQMLEGPRMREKMWKQKLEQTFTNASRTKHGVLLCPPDHPISSIEAFEDVSSSAQNEKAEQLRAARNQEALSHQAGAVPSLVRSEFRTALSYRQAEALINQSRASPETPLGFSLSDNAPRATVET